MTKMSYVIQFSYTENGQDKDISFIVDSLEINRMPKFTYYWDTVDKKPKGIEFNEKWSLKDQNADYFQVSFTTQNTCTWVQHILKWFKDKTVFKVLTPQLCFKYATILSATINDHQINVSLIAKDPFDRQKNLKTPNTHLALEANYRNAKPGFVKTFQFGNYVAISTFPFKQDNKNLQVQVEKKGRLVYTNKYWSIYKLPISSKPQVIPFRIGNLRCYCFTNLPPLFTDVLITPIQNDQYNYIFGVHPSCELSAYLKVEDLYTGEVWYNSGNQGTLTLSPGVYRVTPVVAIPDDTENPTMIEGNETIIHIPRHQIILTFLTPLTLPKNEKLKIQVSEPVILHFVGWKTIEVNDEDTKGIQEITFDYPGTFNCQVYSKKRNQIVSNFTVTVFDTDVTVPDADTVIIRLDDKLVTDWTVVTADFSSYVATSSIGKILGSSTSTYQNFKYYLIDDSMLHTELQTSINEQAGYEISTIKQLKLDSTIPNEFVKTVDVIFHDIPVVDKPVFMSIDGPVQSIKFLKKDNTVDTDVDIKQLSDTLYKVTFKSCGLKKIQLVLHDGTKIEKHVSVSPGFQKILEVNEQYKNDKLENVQIKCKTHDYYAIVRSYSTTKIIPPHSEVSWDEYSFGYTPITVTLVQGTKVVNLQYQLQVYNPKALDIVSYGRKLQLLHVPNAEIDFVTWYIGDMFIGVGTEIEVPVFIQGGKHNVKAVVHSNKYQCTIQKQIEIPHIDANTLQLNSQIINPLRTSSLSSTNPLITIINDGPYVRFEYLSSSINIRLRNYLYLERHTYIGTISDLDIDIDTDVDTD